MDVGSVLLAGTLATVGAFGVLAAIGHTTRETARAIGVHLAQDPAAALVTGVIVQVAFGIVSAFAYAFIWSATGWAIAPLQGALLGLGQWVLAELLVAPRLSRRRRAFGPGAPAYLASYLVYGALLGWAYRPGA